MLQETKIEAVVDTILADYRNGRDIDRMESGRHPDRDAVADILEKLRRLLIPKEKEKAENRKANTKNKKAISSTD